MDALRRPGDGPRLLVQQYYRNIDLGRTGALPGVPRRRERRGRPRRATARCLSRRRASGGGRSPRRVRPRRWAPPRAWRGPPAFGRAARRAPPEARAACRYRPEDSFPSRTSSIERRKPDAASKAPDTHLGTLPARRTNRSQLAVPQLLLVHCELSCKRCISHSRPQGKEKSPARFTHIDCAMPDPASDVPSSSHSRNLQRCRCRALRRAPRRPRFDRRTHRQKRR